jgi:WD40 repeat protein
VLLWVALAAVCAWALPAVPRASWRVGGGTWLVCFSPDGTTLVTTEGDDNGGPICLREATTGRVVRSFAESWRGIRAVVFSPDGRFLAAEADGEIDPVRLGDDGKHAVRSAGGPYLKLWDAATGEELARFHRGIRWVFWHEAKGVDTGDDFRFSPDGRYFIHQRYDQEGDGGAQVRFWDTKQRRLAASLPGEISSLALAPNGNRFALCGLVEGRVLVQVGRPDPESGGVAVLREHWLRFDEVGVPVAFSPALDAFAVVNFGGGTDRQATVRILDLDTGEERGRTTYNPDEGLTVESLSFSPDGRYLRLETFCNAFPGWLRFSTFLDTTHSLQNVHTQSVEATWSPHGDCLLVPTKAGAELFETGCFTRRGLLEQTGDSGPNDQFPLWRLLPELTLSPDGKTVMVTHLSRDTTELPANDWLAGKFTLPKRSTAIAVGRLWDVETRSPLLAVQGCVRALFSPDGKGLALEYWDGLVQLWDVPPRASPTLTVFLATILWAFLLAGPAVVKALRRRRPRPDASHS